MFSLKTIVTSLIGAGIAGSLAALPVRANEAKAIDNAEITVSQIYGNPSNNNQGSDDLKNLVGLTGLAIGTGVVGYQVSKAYKPSFANSLPTTSNGSTDLLIRVSPKLRRELLRLVHNQATANRLLSGTANSHPGRSANWIAEKVIYDLKRDR